MAAASRMSDNEIAAAVRAAMAGNAGALEGAYIESFARRGMEPKTFLEAADLCSSVALSAPHYTGFHAGCNRCAATLKEIGEALAKHLDMFGRP